ncbi:DUF3265 domain-containing protein [Vibrio sp. 2-2(9)]|nr:DUF3265 domain-containing protein [Vibrio sp. 2-2(2)]NNN90902.1 DUF3265 domain-containing protein [Vibrio sp. 2-2(9)]NNO01833.1 DUF3265 domain-containing protein [Vibrio sp. 7-5(1-a)]
MNFAGSVGLTNCLRVIRNAWHFCYALRFVYRVVCVGFGIGCSHLNRALGDMR